jgi:uncharacterized protein (TIGR02117 family)
MLWRILSRTGMVYTAGLLEMFSAASMAFLLVAIYGEVIPTGQLPESGDRHVYIRSNGIHTELCFPTVSPEVDWSTFVKLSDFGDSIPQEYVVFGWGDKGFYMNTPEWEDLTASTALSAILLPTPTAMHVAYEETPVEYNQCVKVELSKAQYRQLIAFVKGSFRQERGNIQLIPNKGYGPNDNFYESYRSYHAFRTCNTWTNRALKHARVRTGILAIFPEGVMRHLRK